jgi:hypothetical protein
MCRWLTDRAMAAMALLQPAFQRYALRTHSSHR